MYPTTQEITEIFLKTFNINTNLRLSGMRQDNIVKKGSKVLSNLLSGDTKHPENIYNTKRRDADDVDNQLESLQDSTQTLTEEEEKEVYNILKEAL